MTSFNIEIADIVTLTDALDSTLSAQCVVTEALTAADLLVVIKQVFDVLTETSTLTSPAEAGLEYQVAATTGVVAGDTAEVTKLVLIVAAEGVTVVDAVIPNASLQALCAEGVLIAALLVVDGEVYVVWVANADTFAHSQYANYNFNSMCRLGNNYYGANDEGIFLLEGADDAGTDIQYFLTVPTTDFGTDRVKRVPKAAMGFSTAGDMHIKVITREGDARVYAFGKTSDAYSEAGAALGRGIKSRYFTFDLYNVEGGEVNMEQIEFFPLFLRKLLTS